MSVDLSNIGESAQVERLDSRWQGIYEALDWPSIVWSLSVRPEVRQMLHGELVARAAPAFLTVMRG